MNFHDYTSLIGFIIKKNQESSESFLENEDFKFREFRKFVRVNKLCGYLYPILNKTNLLKHFPNHFIDDLKNFYDKQRERNNLLIHESEKLKELFDKSEIKVIFLKGPFFSLRFFGDLGQRSSSDIDLLINKTDIGQTDNLLRSEGFKLRSLNLFSENLTTLFTHHYEYRKDKLKVDLHWVLQSHFSFNLNYEEIWMTKQAYFYNGTSYQILSDEYELLLQILSIFMDTQLGTIRLKSFVDVYIMLKHFLSNLDWEEFFLSRKREGLFSISLNVIDFVFSVLNCYKEFEHLSEIIEKNSSFIIYKEPNDKLKLLNRGEYAYSNKIWAFKLYEASLLKTVLWWMISLPFKVSIYREEFLKPIRRSFKQRNIYKRMISRISK